MRAIVSRRLAGDWGGEGGAKVAQGPALPHVETLPPLASLRSCPHRGLTTIRRSETREELPVDVIGRHAEAADNDQAQ